MRLYGKSIKLGGGTVRSECRIAVYPNSRIALLPLTQLGGRSVTICE